MSEQNPPAAAAQGARQSEASGIARFFRATEVDTRMLGMLGALLLIWLAFHLLSDGRFLTPRNLWNLSVQTSSVAIMSTGMVLIIVTRHIDLYSWLRGHGHGCITNNVSARYVRHG